MPTKKPNPELVRLREKAEGFRKDAEKIITEFTGKDMPKEKKDALDDLLTKAEDAVAECKRIQRADGLNAELNEPAEQRPGLFGGLRDEEDGEHKSGTAAGAGGETKGVDVSAWGWHNPQPIDDEEIKAANIRRKFVPVFHSLGDELKAIAEYTLNHTVDPRFEQMENQLKALGANEAVMSEGAFLLQPTFVPTIWKRVYETGQILSRVSKLTCGANSNSITIPTVDESSRAAGSRWGGVRGYWLPEGVAPTPSKPKFGSVELKLKKYMCLGYATDELLADAAIMTSLYNQAFADEIVFDVEEAIFAGTGAGQPKGFMASGAVIAIEKEVGQAADTIVADNISKMWSRLFSRSRANAVWLINQDAEPQLDKLALTVGLGGMPVYLPANGLADSPFGRLKGRPVIPTEHNPTVGDSGDLALVDLEQYVTLNKGEMNAASSMHVAFTTAEMAFRVLYRIDGQPMWKSALTPAKGTNTVSPFVVIEAR